MAACFFFSSRRRHTRWTGDWSSDVCSSDLSSWRPSKLLALGRRLEGRQLEREQLRLALLLVVDAPLRDQDPVGGAELARDGVDGREDDDLAAARSEERRVGKECRCRGGPCQ